MIVLLKDNLVEGVRLSQILAAIEQDNGIPWFMFTGFTIEQFLHASRVEIRVDGHTILLKDRDGSPTYGG